VASGLPGRVNEAAPRGPVSWRFDLALRLGLLLARILPDSWLIAGGARLGACCGRFAPARRTVAQNLRLVEEQRRLRGLPAKGGGAAAAVVRPEEVFASYGRYWGEFLALAARPHTLARWKVRTEGLEHLDAAAERGPVCLLTAHLGNWDLGARWAASRLGGLAVVAEELQPARLYRLFRQIREAGGCRVIPASQGGLSLARHLRGGGHLALVADRPFGAGIEAARWLGARRPLPASGMRLAQQAGASLLPAFLRREGDAFVVRFYPALPPEADPVSLFALALEQQILEHPAQWCVLQPLEAEPESPPSPSA
jgi:lauroyl/myristoyl acyltransferase